MAVDAIINIPAFLKVKTTGNKQHFLNSNLVVSFSPSISEEKATDILMLNGDRYTIKETPDQLIDNRYRRDANKGTSVFNLIG